MDHKMPHSSREAVRRLANFVKSQQRVTLTDYVVYRRQIGDPISFHEQQQLISGLNRSQYLELVPHRQSNGAYHGVLKRKDQHRQRLA